MLLAVTRPVSEALSRCELTHLARAPIDVDLARAQHGAYERALADAGCEIVRVDAAPELPDAVFIEDAAVVFDELAIVTRPGAVSRRAETAAVAGAVGRYRPLRFIEPPATMDGGDVLTVARDVFVGVSSRTNVAAVGQMRALLEPFGYRVHAVSVTGCLHLKSAVTALSDDRLLLNGEWAARGQFASFGLVDVDPLEPAAANIVRAGRELVYPDAFPRTRERIERAGFGVRDVDVSELAKAEGAVTCCSLIFDAVL
jgi:dimethylargininase